MDIKKYKKFNKVILITLLSVLVVLSTFNIIIDPYNVFGSPSFFFNKLKPDAKRQERLTKVLAFKLDRRNIDAVFLGTSRVDWSMDKHYYKQKTGKEAENLGIVGMSFNEYIDFTKTVINIHPEIKNVYLGLDFYTFNKYDLDGQIHLDFNKQPYVTTSELAAVLFSTDATVSSSITIIRNLLKKDMSKIYDKNGLIYVFHNELVDYFVKHTILTYYKRFYKFELETSYYKQLVELDNYCSSKGIKLHLYNTGGHAIDLATIYELERWEIFNKWKKDLTQFTDLYDFYYINDISTCKIHPDMTEFYDSAHNTKYTGHLIIDKLLGGDGEYGRLNTAENIDGYIKQDTRNLKNWMSKNPKWIKMIKDVEKETEMEREENE